MLIYEIRNKINGKVYIGQHNSDELGSYWGSGKLIKLAILKYGIDNFERTVLEVCSSKEELNAREKFWIKEKNSTVDGYNLTEGGTGGDNSKFITYSDEWRYLQKVNTTNHWKSLSKEARDERSDKIKGENNGMFGKKGYWGGKTIPKDIVQKSVESRRCYLGEGNPNWKGGTSKNSCGCGKKINASSKTCKDCRDRKGENNPFFNKKHSEETLKNLSDKRKGKKPTNMVQVIIDGVLYESLAEASRQTGIPSPTILWRVRSKNKKYENYQSHPAIKAPLSN